MLRPAYKACCEQVTPIARSGIRKQIRALGRLSKFAQKQQPNGARYLSNTNEMAARTPRAPTPKEEARAVRYECSRVRRTGGPVSVRSRKADCVRPLARSTAHSP